MYIIIGGGGGGGGGGAIVGTVLLSPVTLLSGIATTLTDLFRTVVELDPSVHLGGPASR